jgi:transposase
LSTPNTIEELTVLVHQLFAEIAALKSEVVLLKHENAKLKEELSIYKNKKNSNNSHVPPSQDPHRAIKNKSLREQTDRKPGGQPGHEGKTLEFTDTVDAIIKHTPNYCKCCGKDLSNTPDLLCEKRQVLDIPPIKVERIEHQTYSKTCTCGQVNKSDFPQEVKAKVQYGTNIEALIGYLHARQYMPVERMKEFFTDVMGVPLSTGGICYILQRLTAKAMPVYEQIKQRIQQAAVVGTDETGCKVNGKTNWFWTWQNPRLTYIAYSDNRGFKTIAKEFENGLSNAILNHDRWACHFQCDAKAHQLCTAHLLRELNYIHELYNCDWSLQFKTIISQAIELKNKLHPTDYHFENAERQNLEAKLNELLRTTLPDKNKKAITFQKKLANIPSYIFYFLHHPKVPPDNNGSERAIRNIKVKQKISGQFKSVNGAISFAVIRSVIDTAIKSGQNVLNALIFVAKFATE